jgi:Transposase DDE domain group 1
MDWNVAQESAIFPSRGQDRHRERALCGPGGKADPAAKPLKGFGGASVLEIVTSHHGNVCCGEAHRGTLNDSRHGLNKQFTVTDLLRQSVYSRLAGHEGLNDAERLAADPTIRLISSQRIWDRGAALTSTLHWFETELLTKEEYLIGLMALNRETLGQAECLDSSDRVVLDMDSSESPVHGRAMDQGRQAGEALDAAIVSSVPA